MHLPTLFRTRTALATALAGLLLTACGGATDDEPTDPAGTPASEGTEEPADGDADEDADSDAGDTGEGTSDGTGSSQDAERSSDDELAMTDCRAERYTVPYPADWQVNDGETVGNCQVFHPGEVEVPDQPQDRDLHWAASLYVDDVAWAEAQPDGEEGEELSQEETTLDGHRALAYEYESNGRALVPEGERGYVYLVDLDDRLLVASTSSVGETDYERDKAVLDEMMAGLTIPAER